MRAPAAQPAVHRNPLSGQLSRAPICIAFYLHCTSGALSWHTISGWCMQMM